MMPRWVVLGGTFDPVHLGHLHIARRAVAILQADRAVLAVGGAHPHREPTVLDRDERVTLVRAAIADDPLLFEAGQLGVEDPSLVNVVRSLATRNDLHVIFGADSAARADRWRGLGELRELATLWAVPRRGSSLRGLTIPTLRIDPLAVSATEVRVRCAAGDDVDPMIPAAIADRVSWAYAPRTAVLS